VDTKIEGMIDGLKAAAVEAMKLALPRRSMLPVGVALLASHADGRMEIYKGGNVETLWQTSHHAERNAIMVAIMAGAEKVHAVVVAAERQLFTPCGACTDLIFEFGGKECVVIHYNPTLNKETRFTAQQLMPAYPTRS
jgi:cytidine deaminase